MKSTRYVPIILLLIFGLSIKAQQIKSTYSTNHVYKGDSVSLEVNDFYGDIQWQKSIGLNNWENINGATSGKILYIADTATYYRAAFVAGICDTTYSDTIQVSVSHPDDFVLIDVSTISNWNHLVLLADGRQVLTKENINNIADTIYFKPNSQYNGFLIYCDSIGIPYKAIIDSTIFLFSNFRDSLVDIAIIDYNDSIYIFKDFAHKIPFYLLFEDQLLKSTQSRNAWKWVAIAASGVGCIAGAATAITGIGLALAGVSCLSFGYELGLQIFKGNDPVFEVVNPGLEIATTAIACASVNIGECVSGTISVAIDLSLLATEVEIEQEDVTLQATDKIQSYTFRDSRDGYVYKTVKIGNQVWMVENLKTTKYNDGTSIPLVTSNSAWEALSTPAYCWYNNDISYKSTYGALYNWYTINTDKLCPTGWHVPSDNEWQILEMYLGMSNTQANATGWRGTNEGGKLKETGTTHWVSPNTGATNITYFTALPGGGRSTNGNFSAIGYRSFWWASTLNSTEYAWTRSLLNNHSNIDRYAYDRKNGFSVRCVKD